MKLIVDGNEDKGKEILEELYLKKYNRAGHTLSYGYGAGWFGEPDPKKYLSLVYALVLKGYSAAFSDYGFCYDCGIVVKKSMRWALYWYRKAADYDDEAQNILGLCYEEGLGVLKDYEKAYYWFQLAVKTGLVLVQNSTWLVASGLAEESRKIRKWQTNMRRLL